MAVLFVALLLAASPRARGAQADEQFQIGRRAFEAQQYQAALEAFEAALAAGLPGPAIHFNIGVCAYRLGRYARAETAFLEAARTPQMSALARYNLGLVELRRGNQQAASRWFALVERESSDKRLQALASAQLAELPQPPEPSLLGYFAAAAGYDDNVALVSGGDVLGVSGTDDAFAELQVAVSTLLAQPWQFDAGLVLLDYQELDSFDQVSATSGARYRRRLGDWNGEAALQFAYATLDGEGFESRRTLGLQASRSLPQNWRLQARYRFSDLEGLNEFDGLDGRRHELHFRTTWQRQVWALTAAYRFDASDYDDPALSLDRHQLAIELQRAIDDEWTFEAELVQEHGEYDSDSIGSEDRTELSLAIVRVLGERWRASVRYAHADNEADSAELDYRRNRITAVIEASW